MRHFLIAGNTRVGSTWLQAALHALPGVFSTREIRWRMPYQEQVWPVHTYVDSTTRSMKERLDHGRNRTRHRHVAATGAKLKFDPYGFVAPAAFASLSRIIEPDILVVLARRSYFEILQTWKVFGIRHLANPAFRRKPAGPASPAVPADPREERRAARFLAVHGEAPAVRTLLLTRDGHALAPARCATGHSGGKPAVIRYPVEEAIDDLLVLFYNDVCALSLIRDRDDALLLDYRDIPERFSGIARRLLPDVTEAECRAILANPATRQIEPDGVQLVFPEAALRAVSAHLSEVFRELHEGTLKTIDVLHHDANPGRVTFALPGLQDILDRYPETRGLAAPPRAAARHRLARLLAGRPTPGARAGAGTWAGKRPIYEPLALAPDTGDAGRSDPLGSHRGEHPRKPASDPGDIAG